MKLVPAVLTGSAVGDRPAVVIRLPDGIVVELHATKHTRAHDVGQRVACLRGAGS